jgi:hypothetical protein
MSARIICLPRTAAGRKLLRECFRDEPDIYDYRWPNGAAIEDDDLDADAAEAAELAARPCSPALIERIQRDIDESPYPPPRGWRKTPSPRGGR